MDVDVTTIIIAAAVLLLSLSFLAYSATTALHGAIAAITIVDAANLTA